MPGTDASPALTTSRAVKPSSMFRQSSGKGDDPTRICLLFSEALGGNRSLVVDNRLQRHPVAHPIQAQKARVHPNNGSFLIIKHEHSTAAFT